MAWCGTGDTPLFELGVTYHFTLFLTDLYIYIYIYIGLSELREWLLKTSVNELPSSILTFLYTCMVNTDYG